jgi:hypothetical protein
MLHSSIFASVSCSHCWRSIKYCRVGRSVACSYISSRSPVAQSLLVFFHHTTHIAEYTNPSPLLRCPHPVGIKALGSPFFPSSGPSCYSKHCRIQRASDPGPPSRPSACARSESVSLCPSSELTRDTSRAIWTPSKWQPQTRKPLASHPTLRCSRNTQPVVLSNNSDLPRSQSLPAAAATKTKRQSWLPQRTGIGITSCVMVAMVSFLVRRVSLSPRRFDQGLVHH